MKIKVKVSDMTCDYCKMKIENQLNEMSDINEINVQLDKKIVEVSGEFEINQVVDAIKLAGYTAEEILEIKP